MGHHNGPRWAQEYKPHNVRGTMKRLLGYIGRYRYDIFFGCIAAVLASILSLIGPQYLSRITDRISDAILKGTSVDMHAIATLGTILILVYLLSVISYSLEHYLNSAASEKIAGLMRKDMSSKLRRMPLRAYDRSDTGDVMSRFTNDTSTLATSFAESISMMITAIVMAIGAFVMMLYTNAQLAVAATLPMVCGMVLVFVVIRLSRKYYRAHSRDLGRMNDLVEEVYYGHSIMRAYNGEEDCARRFRDINDNLHRSAFLSRSMSSMMPSMMHFISNFGYVIVCVLGSMMIVNGEIGYGILVAFIVYVNLFTHPILQLSESLTMMQSVSASAERIFEFLDGEDMEDESGKAQVSVGEIKGKVEFRDVHFSYVPGNEVIHGFSQVVLPGQKIAIVGLTGAGKTTLVNLLMRFYEVDSGDILIDDISIREMSREQVHDMFCMVLQDSWLFAGTLRENIAYTRTDATDEEILRACSVVGLDKLLSRMPGGLDTRLDTSSLSMGQKQQVTIARAIVRNAPLLILDEATSSVDTRSEKHIQKGMDDLMRGRTSFVIAHRLSTICNSDLILVMKDGRIVEQGTHAQLLECNGFYRELYDSQFENCD